jgi:hypothetical protein
MDTAADVLGPSSTPVQTVDAPPSTAMIPMQDSGQTVDVNAPNPSQVATDPGQGATATVQGQPDPVYQDPEMRMGAVHQNWLSHIIDTVGSILGGDQTLTITKSPDGAIRVDHNPSTTAEKWGRVAQAALGGAARGMAVGQGPGGAARAAAAGTEFGLAQPQAQLDQANQQAATMSQQQLRAAQNALLNQQIVQGAWNNAHLTTEWNQKQANYMLDFTKKLHDMGARPEFTNVKDMGQLATYGVSNPLAVDAHLGKNGSMLITMPDGNGGVSGWTIPEDTANQKYDKDWDTNVLAVDPNDPTKTTEQPLHVGANSTTNQDHLTREMAIWVANNKVLEQVAKAKTDQQNADANTKRANTGEMEAQGKPELTASEINKNNAQAVEASANAAKARAATVATGGPPAPAGTFDPNFPPPQNFPPGTPGINPKLIGKVPAATEAKAGLARNIGENTDEAVKIIQAQGDQLLGPAMGRFTTVEQMIGNNDPNISALGTRIHNIAMASVGIHGSRAVGNVRDQETNLLNHFKSGKDAALAALAANKDSAQSFINDERNWNTYGSGTGPIRQAATNTPAPGSSNASQAAHQIPAGAQIGRDAKGNPVGYKLNGVWTPF